MWRLAEVWFIMNFIYLDESGDLGFNFDNKKTSRYFIVTFLFTQKRRSLEKVIKKAFNYFSKKEIKLHNGILHCYKEKPLIRHRILSLLKNKDFDIISISLDKRKVYTKLKDEKHILYNYVTNILLDRIFTRKIIPLDEPIRLIASKRETNKFLNQNFKSFLENQTKNNHNIKIAIEVKRPKEDKVLQIVDFVCWSIFRKLEHGDDSYYNVIKSKIIDESILYS
jgi:hypothetical protein